MLLYALCGAVLALAQPVLANPLSPRQQTTSGSLSLVNGQPSFTFSYSSSPANEWNWIGVYQPGAGPKDGESQGASLVWDWASNAEGEVVIDASSLTPGPYEAFLLANDGYVAIAGPIEIELGRHEGPLSFFLDEVTLKNGRVGDVFEANISGLLDGGGDAAVEYAIDGEDEWLSVSEDGVLSGTPSEAGDAVYAITATSGESITGLNITIPVVDEGKPLVSEVSVLSYNLWHGGTQVNNYHAKQIAFLASGNFDVVALQETTGGHATRLARALGWEVFQSTVSVGIISRYPIAETYPQHGHGGAVRVALDGDNIQVNVWTVHLNAYPYGPYGFCFDNMSTKEVLQMEEDANRGPQVRETLDLMADQLDSKIPIILAGDFNAPSHLDWTDATSDVHCGAGAVDWPTSTAPQTAGLTDSYREIHPDPVSQPGDTWSPTYLTNEGRPEPMDRIDFIYHKGMEVLSSEALVVGQPKPDGSHKDNEWTSDHAAVVSRFAVRKTKGKC